MHPDECHRRPNPVYSVTYRHDRVRRGTRRTSGIDTIKQALSSPRTDDLTNAATHQREFCDEESETRPGFCSNCDSERSIDIV
jgi:hypothetical protein